MTPTDTTPTRWHSLAADDALRLLDSAAVGLSPADAEQRLRDHGANRLPEAPRRPGWLRFALQFHNPLIYVLLVAGGVTAMLGSHVDAGVIMGEAATEKAIEILGDRSDDPSLEELQAVLPQLIDTYGLDAVRMMTIQYSTSLGGFRKLLASDERFALPTTSTNAATTTTATAADTAAQEEKKRLRAERKQKERDERARAEAQRRNARGRK